MNILTIRTKNNIRDAIYNHRKRDQANAKDSISIEERLILLIVRDLLRIGWHINRSAERYLEIIPPEIYEKKIIRDAMAYARNEILEKNKEWIRSHIELARNNLATGRDVLNSMIIPRIEVCETQAQHDIFRIFRYYWSSPSSDYVGRRIKILIRDDGINGSPVIGIAALGSSIIHIPARDKWIGWNTETRTKRIIYMMDAYVIGAVPPYNYLLGGKLISYILASNEIRKIYKEKYININTVIKNRKASDLVLIMTTSLYGQSSSQYNRLRYGKSLLYKPIGLTAGYGSLHISSETFNAMRELAQAKGCNTSNAFGMGPNWRMRVIRTACECINLNSDVILRHSFTRGLYAIPLAINYKSFLRGATDRPIYRNLPLKSLAAYWRERWLNMRRKNKSIIDEVINISPNDFKIEKSDVHPKK